MKSLLHLALYLGLALGLTADGGAAEQVALSEGPWVLQLDPAASWKSDTLYAPGSFELAELPVRPPSGGWDALSEEDGRRCQLPVTLEELFAEGKPTYRYHGVSWCWRDIDVPNAWRGKKIRLQVEKSMFRAEVFVNGKLVGLDMVPETPFAFDISEALTFGERNRIAFRLTNPGGTRGWEDIHDLEWGKHKLLWLHDFTCLGHVDLAITDPVYIEDVFVKNLLPTGGRALEVQTTMRNDTGAAATGRLHLRIASEEGGDTVFEDTYPIELPPGTSANHVSITVPGANLWDMEHPHLYQCRATLEAEAAQDRHEVTFGFRTVEVRDVDGRHVLFLNGRRIRHRSAIDWGFYALTGAYATPEMARASVEAAKAIGHNGINFHRRMGEPLVLDCADKMGLYMYEEPGGLHAYAKLVRSSNPLNEAIHLERCRRMVLRDRNHPSLLIYNLSNEDNLLKKPNRSRDLSTLVPFRVKALRLIHELDGTRLVVNSSGGNGGGESGYTPHLRPYESEIRWDYQDDHTVGSKAHFQEEDLLSHNKVLDDQMFYYGEVRCYTGPDNAVAITDMGTRLKNGSAGYDGHVFSGQSKTLRAAFRDYRLAETGSRRIRTPADITRQTGRGLMYINGRLGQRIMANPHCSGYAINGWSGGSYAEPGRKGYWNWASALVDEGRNLKGPAEDLAWWTRELQVALFRTNGKYFKPGKTAIFEAHLINEGHLPPGRYELLFTATDGAGRETAFREVREVEVRGGACFAEELGKVEVALQDTWHAGHITVHGELRRDGKRVADGCEQVLLQNRASYADSLAGLTGAVVNWDPAAVALKEAKAVVVDAATHKGALDYVVAGSPPAPEVMNDLLKRVHRDGTRLVIRFNEPWAARLKKAGLLSAPVREWGGTQKGGWLGNGWGYLDHFVGAQAVPSGPTIGTTGWEVPGDPVGFFPFKSKHPIRAYGMYVARPSQLLVLLGEIEYGQGRILLCPGYPVDQNNAFTDLLFFNLLVESQDE